MSEHAPGAVLVTGADTPVMRELIAALRREQPPREVVWVTPSGGDAPIAVPSGVRALQAELTNHRAVRDLLFGPAAAQVDTVVHGVLELDPLAEGERVRELNVVSTRELLAAAEEQPRIARFVLRSFGSVYRRAGDEPVLLDESEALDLSAAPPAGQRSRVEADITVSTRIAGSRLQIVVLRCAEVLAEGSGSQLYDYLSSRVCLRPLGYDPMINVLSLRDLGRAAVLAARSDARGIYNVPGYDTLPLSELVYRSGRLGVALPGPLLTPLYRLRSAVAAGHFDYPLDATRFHYGAILDGGKARRELGYAPEHRVALDALFAGR